MSDFGKFKRGDRVLSLFDSPATVKRTYRCPTTKRIKVVYVSDLTGFESICNEEELKFNNEDLEVSKKIAKSSLGDKCPKCSNPWTITKFGSTIWYDCSTCKKKAEDLVDASFEEMFGEIPDWDIF